MKTCNRTLPILAAAAAMILGIRPAPASDTDAVTARGIVYNDLNANDARDPSEPGIPGVRVSNGRDIVLTDGDGVYEMTLDQDDIIFVIKPRGYQTRIDHHNIPRFYRIHKPAGSPDESFLYKGVEPTGSLPDSVDFPLTRRDASDAFSAVFVGDPQPYSIREADWYARTTIADLVGTDAAFGVSLGDLVGDRLELFGPINQAQSRAGVPWYNIYGNHDMNFHAPNDEHADETFERVYGPTNHAFQYGSVHFIVLDNVIWRGFEGLRDDGRPENNNYRGGLRDDQLRFVENFLATVPRDELVVLMFHIPIEGGGVHRVPEQRELFEILSSHPKTLSLSGHTHLQRHWFFGETHGYTPGTEHHHLNAATASGSWYRGATDVAGVPHAAMRCGAPKGYNIIDFDGAEYRIRYRAAAMDPDHQMRIWVPDEIDAGEDAEVIANIFAGSERSRVYCRINDGPWRPMDFDPRHDPHLRAIKELEQSAMPPNGRPIPDLRESHHIWSMPLPADLPTGYHTIEVKTTDMFGATHKDATMLRVAGD